jgi:cell division protein FtsB
LSTSGDKYSSSQIVSKLFTWGFARILVTIVVIFSFVYLVFSSDGGLLQILSLKKERDNLIQEIDNLNLEKEQLEFQIDRLAGGDSLVIEAEARVKGMVKEGEEVYRLQYKELSDSSTKKQ